MRRYNEYSYEEKMYLIYSLKCPLQCEHCLTNSAPYRKEKMEINEAIEIIKQIYQMQLLFFRD